MAAFVTTYTSADYTSGSTADALYFHQPRTAYSTTASEMEYRTRLGALRDEVRDLKRNGRYASAREMLAAIKEAARDASYAEMPFVERDARPSSIVHSPTPPSRREHRQREGGIGTINFQRR